MSVKRLNEMENIIQKCGAKRGTNVVYALDDITDLLKLLDKEKSIQDRKVYASAYYIKNKEKMDKRAREYYAARKAQKEEGEE